LPAIEEIASSRARLKISSLISSRPRTLGELAQVTGISIQGVLKHLKKLEGEGVVKEWSMPSGKYLRPRKLYYMESHKVADFSQGDLLVASLGRVTEHELGPRDKVYDELDRLAQDIIMQERRVRELSRRMLRMIDEVVDSESRIGALIASTEMAADERQVAHLIFGDDGPERARKILSEHYGCPDPDSAIHDVSLKIRRSSQR